MAKSPSFPPDELEERLERAFKVLANKKFP